MDEESSELKRWPGVDERSKRKDSDNEVCGLILMSRGVLAMLGKWLLVAIAMSCIAISHYLASCALKPV